MNIGEKVCVVKGFPKSFDFCAQLKAGF